MTKESLTDSLFELNSLIINLREKLRKSLNEVLQLRKDLDLSREENQLIELKYQALKDMVSNKLDNKIDAARGAIQEVVNDSNKK
tara:strand:+ start:724 stop:978 length:255 start_codon:yes stop_codon:yes gene_type:complete